MHKTTDFTLDLPAGVHQKARQASNTLKKKMYAHSAGAKMKSNHFPLFMVPPSFFVKTIHKTTTTTTIKLKITTTSAKTTIYVFCKKKSRMRNVKAKNLRRNSYVNIIHLFN